MIIVMCDQQCGNLGTQRRSHNALYLQIALLAVMCLDMTLRCCIWQPAVAGGPCAAALSPRLDLVD